LADFQVEKLLKNSKKTPVSKTAFLYRLEMSVFRREKRSRRKIAATREAECKAEVYTLAFGATYCQDETKMESSERLEPAGGENSSVFGEPGFRLASSAIAERRPSREGGNATLMDMPLLTRRAATTVEFERFE